ncbi:MAG: Gfo/Idh/MocA family oxidoreductase [Kiritimatiellae bacterium]|nr:Gfo/Idh/MocA family oxidoreductase [Kiritimatiellia bacterium]
MKKLRVMQVGAWGRGRAFLDPVKNSDRFEYAALVDVRAENIVQARETVPLPEDRCFGDLDEALAKVPCEVVFVITPPDLHARHCLAALDAGRHVLVEKPFTKTGADARTVVQKAQEKGLCVVVSQNRRYSAACLKARELIEAGAYGKICAGVLCKSGFRGGVHHSGQDEHAYLWERGVHDIDTLLHYVAPRKARRVCAKSFNPPFSPYKGGASAYGWIEFDDGSVFSLVLSFMSHSKLNESVIECENASIVVNGKVRIERAKGETELVDIAPGAYKGALDYVLEALYDYVTRGVEPPISGRNNLATIELIEALGRSSDENRIVELR